MQKWAVQAQQEVNEAPVKMETCNASSQADLKHGGKVKLDAGRNLQHYIERVRTPQPPPCSKSCVTTCATKTHTRKQRRPPRTLFFLSNPVNAASPGSLQGVSGYLFCKEKYVVPVRAHGSDCGTTAGGANCNQKQRLRGSERCV